MTTIMSMTMTKRMVLRSKISSEIIITRSFIGKDLQVRATAVSTSPCSFLCTSLGSVESCFLVFPASCLVLHRGVLHSSEKFLAYPRSSQILVCQVELPHWEALRDERMSIQKVTMLEVGQLKPCKRIRIKMLV